MTVLTPTEYVGAVIELCQGRRGEQTRMEYLSEDRVELVYAMPLAEIVTYPASRSDTSAETAQAMAYASSSRSETIPPADRARLPKVRRFGVAFFVGGSGGASMTSTNELPRTWARPAGLTASHTAPVISSPSAVMIPIVLA